MGVYFASETSWQSEHPGAGDPNGVLGIGVSVGSRRRVLHV